MIRLISEGLPVPEKKKELDRLLEKGLGENHSDHFNSINDMLFIH